MKDSIELHCGKCKDPGLCFFAFYHSFVNPQISKHACVPLQLRETLDRTECHQALSNTLNNKFFKKKAKNLSKDSHSIKNSNNMSY